jgi:hypothetical protein
VRDRRRKFGLVAALAAVGVVGALALPPMADARSGLISGLQIRKHSIPGNRMKANTLTGAQINESRLGEVPHAAQAKGLSTLPSGKSESGVYAAGSGDSTGGWIGVGITFAQPLAQKIAYGNAIWTGNGADTHCPGPGYAARGYLCLYDAEHYAVSFYGDRNDLLPAGPGNGSIIWFNPTATNSYVAGVWTVTAP